MVLYSSCGGSPVPGPNVLHLLPGWSTQDVRKVIRDHFPTIARTMVGIVPVMQPGEDNPRYVSVQELLQKNSR